MSKVLVIEDDSLLLSDVMKILSLEGFEVLGAPNGITGLEMIRQHLPDLVICDVLMPGKDGYMVLLELRSDPLTSDIPLIFLTAKTDREDIRRGMEMGADDYLTKPFTHHELLSAIQARLQKRKILTQEYADLLIGLRKNLVHALPQELHAPLNGILQFSRVLMEDCNVLPPNQLYQIAHGVEKAAERIHQLIENYLVYVQLELLATNPERLKTLETHILDEPCDIIRAAVSAKAKELERSADIKLECANVRVHIDSNGLNKVVTELVEHVFRMSNSGTSIEISAYIEDHYLGVSILAAGRGLTSSQLASIGSQMQFEDRLYEHQSLELGLVIARRLIELHQGEFRIESTPETGTQFIIKLRQA